jgi:hypothetical protein
MLPDFATVKRRANRDLFRWVRQQVPVLTPLIRGVGTFRQHEGTVLRLVRADESEEASGLRPSEFTFALEREDMRRFDLVAIQKKLTQLAKEMGDDQAKRLLEVVGQAADSVGNVVHAGGDLTPEHLLEILRRVQMDFDAKTLQPEPGFMWVMHPDTAAQVVPRAKEWEKDPAFQAEYERIMSAKREEWRDREARRKLVD